MYKIRVILDTKEDVIRTIMINEKQTLEKLHFSIAKSFGFNAQEMASFYRCDNNWSQGKEIPLFNMHETEKNNYMANYSITEILPNKNNKLIYVYDFLLMWTFYVELLEKSNEKIINEKNLLSVGKIPNKAPDNNFTTNNLDSFENDEY